MFSFQVLVILLAAALFGPAVYGVTQLKQDFNPDWFIPSDTYLYDYRQADEEFFSDASSIPAAVYLGKVAKVTNIIHFGKVAIVIHSSKLAI